MTKKQLQNYINESPVNHMFVITAIDKLASQIIEREAEVLAQKNMVVAPESWVKAAKDSQLN